MKRLIAVFLAAGFAVSALAVPRAESPQECGIAADMALVAQSLAEERIERARAGAIMARIYDVSESERGKALMSGILEHAYQPGDRTPGSSDASAQKLATELYAACIRSGGNMESVLGRQT